MKLPGKLSSGPLAQGRHPSARKEKWICLCLLCLSPQEGWNRRLWKFGCHLRPALSYRIGEPTRVWEMQIGISCNTNHLCLLPAPLPNPALITRLFTLPVVREAGGESSGVVVTSLCIHLGSRTVSRGQEIFPHVNMPCVTKICCYLCLHYLIYFDASGYELFGGKNQLWPVGPTAPKKMSSPGKVFDS